MAEKEYIEREAVLRDWPLCDEPADAYQFIRGFPAADVVERKTGKWIHLGGDEWCCSSCGYVITTEGSWEHPIDTDALYCKHCGAKMEGSDDV